MTEGVTATQPPAARPPASPSAPGVPAATTGAPPVPTVAVSHLWKVFGDAEKRLTAAGAPGAPDLDPASVEAAIARYGGMVAVHDLTFDVSPGEVFVVMGLSGSGKSTLVRCLTRLIEPTAGRVLLDGDDIRMASAERLRDAASSPVLDGLPALRPAAPPPGARQHRVRSGAARRAEGRPDGACSRDARPSSASTGWPAAIPTSSRVASSSASGSPGHWPATLRSCSSTSRSAPSTR